MKESNQTTNITRLDALTHFQRAVFARAAFSNHPRRIPEWAARKIVEVR